MFKIGDLIIDHIAQGLFTDNDDNIVYVLSQLSSATINVTAESTDINDARGNRVARIYRGKTGEFTATNAFISEPLIASKSGGEAEIATAAKPITMPRIAIVKSGETITLTGFDTSKHSISVLGTDANFNAANKTYVLGTTASATDYTIDSANVFTPPTDTDVEQFVVRYDRDVTEGVKIVNSANDMPKSGKLYLKVLVIDPCDNDTLTAAYFELPSFTPSPEMEINVSGGDQQGMDYSGALNVNYCSPLKELFIYYRAANEAE